MGLGLDNTLRQKHKTYLFPKSQNNIVKYTFLPLRVCGGGGGGCGVVSTHYSMLEKIFFKSYSIFIWGELFSFLAYCYDLQKI